MEHIGTQLKRHIKSVILDILVTNMTNHFTDKMSWKGMSSQNINFFSVCENCGKSYHRQDVLERHVKSKHQNIHYALTVTNHFINKMS